MMDMLLQEVVPWLVTYGLHSTALIGVVWLLVKMLPSESNRVQELLWRVALLGPLVTATLQCSLEYRPLAGRFVIPEPQAAVVEPDQVTASAPTVASWEPSQHDARLAFEDATPHITPDYNSASAGDATIQALAADAKSVHPIHSAPSATLGRDLPRQTPDVAATTTANTVVKPLLSPGSWRWILLSAWGIGVLLGLTLLFFAWHHILDRIAGRREMKDGVLLELLEDLCDRSGTKRRPRLCISSRLHSPATVGVLRTQIVVPERAVTELSRPQQRAMLGHELAHIVRHDPQWFFLYRLVERLFFFQPLNRIARSEIQELAEYQCDDWAVNQVGQGLDLARCLTEVAGWMLRERNQVALLPMAGHGSQLGHRVRRLLDEESRKACAKTRPWGRPLIAGVMVAGASALPSVAAESSQAFEALLDRALPSFHAQKNSAPAPKRFDFTSAQVALVAARSAALALDQLQSDPWLLDGLIPGNHPENDLLNDEDAGLPLVETPEFELPDPIVNQWESLSSELLELEVELRSIESRLSRNGPDEELRLPLQTMRAQLESLRAKQGRMESLRRSLADPDQ